MAQEIRTEVLDRQDIQGLILRGYADLHDARYYFLRIEDVGAFKLWLGERLEDRHVSTAATPTQEEHEVLNLAFTATGLRKLGVNPDARLNKRDSFPLEFREGMTEPARSLILGDVDHNHPDSWEWGGRAGERSQSEIDCLCLTFASEAAHPHRSRPVVDLWTRIGPSSEAAKEIHALDGRLDRDGKEHFGFRDGISQPILRFTRLDYETSGAERQISVVEPGEFILGYENEHRHMPLSPWVARARDFKRRLRPLASSRWAQENGVADLCDFGRNGTYLVFRQLRQDVATFRQFLQATAGRDPRQQHLLGAQMVGRWRSGAPLVLWPDRDPAEDSEEPEPEPASNSFGYFSDDRHGHRCPLGAHIRRGNPRDATTDIDGQIHALHRSNLHRLIRRGRVYGPPFPESQPEPVDDGLDRGLMFVCVNADIRRQFEFVQQVWMNGNKFGGLFDERDPLLAGHGTFTIQTPNIRTKPQLRQFVSVKGGAYFFMPGLAALRCLADSPEE